MAIDLSRSNNIYASDLLTTKANASTVGGLNADQFLRSDVDSGPVIDASISLGDPSHRFKAIYALSIEGLNSINGINTSLFMRRDAHNLPTINSNGTTGFDLGGPSNY